MRAKKAGRKKSEVTVVFDTAVVAESLSLETIGAARESFAARRLAERKVEKIERTIMQVG